MLIGSFLDDRTCSFFFFLFSLVTGPGRSLSLTLSDTRVYEPQIRSMFRATLDCSEDSTHIGANGSNAKPMAPTCAESSEVSLQYCSGPQGS